MSKQDNGAEWVDPQLVAKEKKRMLKWYNEIANNMRDSFECTYWKSPAEKDKYWTKLDNETLLLKRAYRAWVKVIEKLEDTK